MKNLYTLVAVLIGLVSVSCQKISYDMENNKGTVKTVASASIIDNNDATKVSLCDLGDDSKETKKLTWAALDKIYVLSSHTVDMFALNEFNITSTPGSKSAEFSYAGTVDFSGAPLYSAFYGKKSALTGANNTLYTSTSETTRYNSFGFFVAGMPSRYYGGNTYVGLYFPWTQKYSVSGPDPAYLFMQSTKSSSADLTNLQFENLTSIIRFRIKDSRAVGDRSTVDNIKLVCEGKPISGLMIGHMLGTVDETEARDIMFAKSYNISPSYDNNNQYASFTSGGSFGDTVILENVNTLLTDEPQDFYMVVWNGAHGDITLTITPSEGSAKAYKLSSFTTEKGVMYKMPIIDFGEL